MRRKDSVRSTKKTARSLSFHTSGETAWIACLSLAATAGERNRPRRTRAARAIGTRQIGLTAINGRSSEWNGTTGSRAKEQTRITARNCGSGSEANAIAIGPENDSANKMNGSLGKEERTLSFNSI